MPKVPAGAKAPNVKKATKPYVPATAAAAAPNAKNADIPKVPAGAKAPKVKKAANPKVPAAAKSALLSSLLLLLPAFLKATNYQ